MSRNLPILLGVFVVMALSNAVVPVLPDFAGGAAMQGAVYAAYFFGVFVTVLPAGMASDRIGRVPLIHAGLLLTLTSGILILIFPSGLPRELCQFSAGEVAKVAPGPAPVAAQVTAQPIVRPAPTASGRRRPIHRWHRPSRARNWSATPT